MPQTSTSGTPSFHCFFKPEAYAGTVAHASHLTYPAGNKWLAATLGLHPDPDQASFPDTFWDVPVFKFYFYLIGRGTVVCLSTLRHTDGKAAALPVNGHHLAHNQVFRPGSTWQADY